MDAEIENKIPNQTTLDAILEMDEDIKNPNLKTYNFFDELLNDLDDEATPFYSEKNQRTLEQRYAEIKASPAILKEHDLIEVAPNQSTRESIRKKYNPSDFPYPLNESMEEVYALYDKGDMDHLIPAIYHLYFDIKDLYTFKRLPLEEVKEIQNYFLGFLND